MNNLDPVKDPNNYMLYLGENIVKMNKIDESIIDAINEFVKKNKDKLQPRALSILYDEMQLQGIVYSQSTKHRDTLHLISHLIPRSALEEQSKQEILKAKSPDISASRTVLDFLKETGQQNPRASNHPGSPSSTVTTSPSPSLNVPEYESDSEEESVAEQFFSLREFDLNDEEVSSANGLAQDQQGDFIEIFLDELREKGPVHENLGLIERTALKIIDEKSIEDVKKWYSVMAQEILVASWDPRLSQNQKNRSLDLVEDFYVCGRNFGDVQAGVNLAKFLVNRYAKDNPEIIFNDFKNGKTDFSKLGLALCYYEGKGIEQSDSTAIQLLCEIIEGNKGNEVNQPLVKAAYQLLEEIES